MKIYTVYATTGKTDKLAVNGNAKLTINGGTRCVYYVEDICVDDNAEFIINDATEYGIRNDYGSVAVKGNAYLKVASSEYGIKVENGMNISNKAKVLITGDTKAIYSSDTYQVTPDENCAYEVMTGKSKASADMKTYYEDSGSQSTKSGTAYFYAASKTAQGSPEITIDYSNEVLKGFKDDSEYTVNGEDVTIEDGVLSIDESWFGSTISIVCKGDENTAQSRALELAISSRPEAPEVSGNYDISLSDTSKFVYTVAPIEKAEYRMDNGEWQESNIFDGIDPASKHTFYARIRAAEDTPASLTGNSGETEFRKRDGEVSFSDTLNLNKAYDGMAVSVKESDVNANSNGKITYRWYAMSAESWIEVSETPTEAGSYRVVAVLEETDIYTDAVSEAYEFTIGKADNSIAWDSFPSESSTYGSSLDEPDASSIFGEVSIIIIGPDGSVYDSLPCNPAAGKWEVIAKVNGTLNYDEVQAYRTFEVLKAIPETEIPVGLKTAYGSTLKDIELPDGFCWVDENVSVGDTGTKSFKAIYTPEDTNNYSTVDLDLEITVEKAKNQWVKNLTVSGWTYGDEAEKPSSEAQFGTVHYLYSDSKDGQYTENVPCMAGTWYVKAVVSGTDNYSGLESAPVEFIIKEKSVSYPADDDKSGETVSTVVSKDTVQTGDDTSIFTYIGAGTLAAGIIFVMEAMKKKQKINKRID